MSLSPPMSEPQFLNVAEAPDLAARRIAYRVQPPAAADKPSIIWLAGLKSDMLSTKATALADWAPTRGMGLTRFDYSGHGESSGKFEEALISHWVEEAMCVLEQLTAGPQILVGSSTGAHVALVLLRRLIQKKSMYADRIKGLVLIAPAWDLTEELMWKTFPDDGRKAIETQGFYDMPSDYGEPYRITRAFIEDGRRDLIRPDPFDPGRPVEVLQGLLDDAVPAPHTRELASVLHGDWVRLTEIADGDHRLSRDPDIELLFEAIERVAG